MLLIKFNTQVITSWSYWSQVSFISKSILHEHHSWKIKYILDNACDVMEPTRRLSGRFKLLPSFHFRTSLHTSPLLPSIRYVQRSTIGYFTWPAQERNELGISQRWQVQRSACTFQSRVLIKGLSIYLPRLTTQQLLDCLYSTRRL